MESLAVDLSTMVRTPLQPEHVEALGAIGTERTVQAGEWIAALGAPADTFHYLLEGEAEAVDPLTLEQYGDAYLSAGQFTGEISLLTGGMILLPIRARTDVRLLYVPRDQLIALMAEVPEMSDIIVTVLAGRRRRLLESNQASLSLYGLDDSRELGAIAAFCTRNRIPYRVIEEGSDQAALLSERGDVTPGRPVALFGATVVLDDPTPQTIARLFGLDLSIDEDEVHDVLIVGGGPSGIAAAVYAGAEGLSALLLEDQTIGGQAGTSSRIENYMGFPTGISGADLCWRGEVQALKFGTRFAVPRRASHLVQLDDGTFCVEMADGQKTCAASIVVATGVQYRRLPVPGLEDFEGAGVYYAATEIEARFSRGAEVAIIGGGNSAGQAAMFLSRHASHVHLLIRSDSLAASMSSYLRDRLEADPRITIHYRTQAVACHGDARLEAVTFRGPDGDCRVPLRSLFVMVGAAPNTDWLGDMVQTDDKGFVLTGDAIGASSPYQTSTPGVFAVGDVRAGSVKRVASAVGEGSVAISKVWEHVNADT